MKVPSLRLQLSLWLLLPLLALLALDAWMTYHRAMDAAHEAFDRTLEASLKSMREGIRLHEGRFAIDVPYLALEIFESEDGSSIYYAIRDEHGATLTGYDDLPMPAVQKQALYKTVFHDAHFRGQPIRMAAQPLPVRDTPSGQTRLVWVLVGETIEPRQMLAREILMGSLQQEMVLVTLALGIVWLGVRRGLRPLHRLSATVAARDADDLAPLEQKDLPAEIEPLVEAINQYVARMHRMLLARKRFFADAAHQLKTPLAIMQAQSELALRERDGDRIRPHLRPLHDTVRQAARGVQQLLSLSRLEPDSGYAPALQPLRLDALAKSVALDLAPVARAGGVDLGFEAPAPVYAMGQAELLQELTGNLVENAIRHTGRDASVTVRVCANAGEPLLQVVDNGPGIAASEREKVFERFYRCDGNQVQEGSGLGLPIVQEIARTHGATVMLEETPGGGLTVSVRFRAPAAEGHGDKTASR
ncbi:sensor histidine kinase N-terminal domain-containing protein [Cupriavidus basilensis]|uniref:histidine kinase n=1 Tax=Cupriavidus basilensis TaxID=68895 RepID=A0ABT6AM14_9BURK|nr:sensor histidine kinase [Cupriavidus basilensis]MDF3833655.1 sensor histidine kinase N-terminal domain-containing protein [Cupriavidus basilensis]